VISVPKGDSPTRKGTWWPLGHNNGRSASFCCPSCGLMGVLTEHEIGDRGSVTPSVVCPADDCDFHDYICLEDWAA
jgi:hypothetical protein